MELGANNDEDATKTIEKQAILLKMLENFNDAIEKGNFKVIEDIINRFHKDLSCNKELLTGLYESGKKCITQTDLIFSACFHKNADVLFYLLNETDILDHLTHANFDVKQVNKKRTAALRYAICSGDFSMVEALYDYWSGNQHWSGHDINNIERIGFLLVKAYHDCEQYLIRNIQLWIDVHCLIKFNHFQCKIYTDLSKTETYLSEGTKNAKAIGTMILSLLRNYDRYSDLSIVKLSSSDNLKIKNELEDKSSIYRRAYVYLKHENYFRKLDFNVALLVLDNLNVLRRHLKKRFNHFVFIDNNLAQKYDEIESTVYNFIYRSSEDWRLYLPTNRKLIEKRNCVGIYNGQIITNLALKYDEQKIYNGAVLYLERKNFKKCLKKLKKILKKHVISRTPAKKKDKVSISLDENYLKKNSYLNDYYSLKKIVHYIKIVENANGINVLMIERALQVIGEMLKSTKDSSHLSKTTKALLQTALSVETINHTYSIRKYLSHVAYGELKTRINMGSNLIQIFGKIKEDLKETVKYIYPILGMYKLILDKSLLEQGLGLIDKRLNILPEEAKPHIDDICERFKTKGTKHEKDYMKEVWQPKGFSEQLLREIPWIMYNRECLESKKDFILKSIHANLDEKILPKCIENMKQTLQLITTHNDNVTIINDQLRQKNIKPFVPAYPNRWQINDIYNKLEKNMKKKNDLNKDLLEEIKKLKDNIITDYWNSVKLFLNFIFSMDFVIFVNIDFSVVNKDSVPDTDTVNNVRNLLDEMKIQCNIQNSGNYRKGSFDGIKELDEIISTKNKNDPDTLISSVIHRIDELKTILDYPKRTLEQLLLKYRRDHEFRIVLEMLLVDIANILVECKIRKMNKSAKLLTGIDMGNVLDHGNPFIDVIGHILNPKDFPTELLTKAFMFAEDRDIIAEIYKLYKQANNKDRESIKRSYQGNNENFAIYLKLIPNIKK